MPNNRYYDNTRVSAYRECPRKYYFRHIMHFRRKGNAPALAFGSAWHDAMDVVWSQLGHKPDADVLQLACLAWNKRWTDEGFPGFDEITPDDILDLKQRTPDTAMEMIANYISYRGDFIKKNEVLACEYPFAVPLDPADDTLWYVGRLDKQIRLVDEDKVIVGEHKTTSLYSIKQGIQPKQMDEYSPNSQIDGYLHANHMLHGNKAKSVWVDLALVHKTVHDVFKWVAVDREVSQLSAWLWETNYVIGQIESNTEILQQLRVEDHSLSYLPAFPKNTNSCNGRYGRCTYADLCKYVSNPENKWPVGSDPPDDFIVEKWEPFNVLELDKLGMEAENV